MVNINGFVPWERKNEFLKQISIVMGQKNQLWWDIPASESFLLNQRIYEIDEIQFKRTRNELVDLLGVQEKLNVQVRRLSLGERMKMEIIASLLHNPSIVLFDEPTIGLDVVSQSKIREFVKYYNEQHKTTFLLTSHYMNDIEALCKRVFVIHKGSSLYDGNFETLINKVKPPRKLMFEFSNNIDISDLGGLKKKFEFQIQDRILTAESTDDVLNSLMASLFKLDTPISFSIEDLPVEDSMKSFFENPEHFLS
jgi:ABC-2 type transport system ATP-binding protein